MGTLSSFTATSPEAPTSTHREAHSAPMQLLSATVVAASGQDSYTVDLDGLSVEARVGVILPSLVAGDEVLLARSERTGQPVITALLTPSAAMPWHDRPIRLQSQQSITLTAGVATLRLTAAGVARLVALTIEQDARDLVDIDAAEVRIN